WAWKRAKNLAASVQQSYEPARVCLSLAGSRRTTTFFRDPRGGLAPIAVIDCRRASDCSRPQTGYDRLGLFNYLVGGIVRPSALGGEAKDVEDAGAVGDERAPRRIRGRR